MSTLRRELGRLDATNVVIGAIIGVGIFFTPSEVARLAGRADVAMGVWALGGVVAVLGAFTFAALGQRYPVAGGQYAAIRDAWGPLAGFLYVVANLTAMQPGTCAIIALLCVQNVGVAVGTSITGVAQAALAGLLVAGLAGANALGVRQGARVQNLTVYTKVTTLVAVVLIAAAYGAQPVADMPAGAAVPPAATWFAALLPALFSYGGWQQALWIGGEIRDPEKNLPFAIVAGVGVVVAVYLAAAWAYFALLGYDGVVGAGALAAEAVGTVLPGVGPRIVAAGVAVSAFGVLNVQFLTGPRLTWALSRDGRFPAMFGTLHAGTRTPVAAIALLAALSLGVLAVGADRIGALTAWVVAVDAMFFALTALALVRRTKIEAPLTIPMWIPIVFASLEVGAVAGALTDPSVRGSALVGLAWIGGAALFYPLTKRRAG